MKYYSVLSSFLCFTFFIPQIYVKKCPENKIIQRFSSLSLLQFHLIYNSILFRLFLSFEYQPFLKLNFSPQFCATLNQLNTSTFSISTYHFSCGLPLFPRSPFDDIPAPVICMSGRCSAHYHFSLLYLRKRGSWQQSKGNKRR